ncbi:hypothetical protein HN51_000876 [Arachis hypogaea]|uniref:Alkyl transferase n=1 Tax=Arachis hypogaea TaxID=3818 RepID=A0A445EUE1_ARAHY|nr:dehydrodolichyl diphosphate synthase 6 [Arachis hypogaea]RYR79011.1 hypothetical protein Ahy_A01g003873 [Arachis hypogaea]
MQISNGYTVHLLEGLYCYLRRLLFKVLCVGEVPNHIAFIMDGNRRFAKKNNLAEGEGHKAGFSALLSILRYCYELGVKYVTVYAFSIDNFRRKPKDVQSLMELMRQKIEELLQQESIINEYGVRLHFIGNISMLSEPVRVAVDKAMRVTAHNNHRVLFICVAYTSRDEMVHAVYQSCKQKWSHLNGEEPSKVVKNGGIEKVKGMICSKNGVFENKVEKHSVPPPSSCSLIELVDVERNMYMAVAPDPDILIRTSGEARLSNFLLWQAGTCPLYAPSSLWPEIGLRHLVLAVLNFQKYHHYLENKKEKKKHKNF